MPRDIPVGNGKLLIAFDRDYRIRDIYYPHVGQENHLGGHCFRIGFRVNGSFAWAQAPSGTLDMNPIAQGSVDSTIGISLTVAPKEKDTFYYYLVCGRRFAEVDRINEMVVEKTPELFLRRTHDYWKLWVNKEDLNFGPLSGPVVDLYKRSLLVLRTQIDADGSDPG